MKCPHCNKDIETIYVRVTGSQVSTYWYSKEIGNVFEVFKEPKKDNNYDNNYGLVVDHTRLISIKDAEIVKVIK